MRNSRIKEAKDVDLLTNLYVVDVTGAYHKIQQVICEKFSYSVQDADGHLIEFSRSYIRGDRTEFYVHYSSH